MKSKLTDLKNNYRTNYYFSSTNGSVELIGKTFSTSWIFCEKKIITGLKNA